MLSQRGESTLRALITGIAGFAGSHLADHLLTQEGIEVFGICLPGESTRKLLSILDRIELYPVDLHDAADVRRLMGTIHPDLIFHLAAQASVERAWANPAETLATNITIQLNLLQAIIALGIAPRLLIVGSADEYGLVRPDDLPIDEDTPLRPLNPYAVSKVTQDFLGLQYHLSHHLPIVRVRPFNHIGPRQGRGFVVPDFCAQIARIEAGLAEPVLKVGNLSAQRDFTDVRDIVRGYYLALTKGTPGQVYNLGSSRAQSIQGIVDSLLGMSHVTVHVEMDPARMRPSDIPTLVCDSSRLQAETGWKPEYTLQQSLQDALDDWRERIRQEQKPTNR